MNAEGGKLFPTIQGFRGEYDFLSNFYRSPIEYEGIKYSTVEHAYQASKSPLPAMRAEITKLKKPGSAKAWGRALVHKREDWEEVKVQVMLDLLRLKFQNPILRDRLLVTGDAFIEETNWWGDTFWGVCRGEGKNILGKLLMQVRSELQA